MKCPKCHYLGFDTGDRCKHCGYDLTNLTEPRCPECGNLFDLSNLSTFENRYPREWHDRAVTILILVSLGVIIASIIAGWFLFSLTASALGVFSTECSIRCRGLVRGLAFMAASIASSAIVNAASPPVWIATWCPAS